MIQALAPSSYATYQMGRGSWDKWSTSIMKKVRSAQRQDVSFKGSWDPAGPIGNSRGRLYSTALMVMTVEVYSVHTHGGR